jgi:hypothetical protein
MSGISYIDGSRIDRTEPIALELPTMQAIKQITRWANDARCRAGAEVGIVCENYKQRPGPLSNQPDALHSVGALRYFCWDNDISFLLEMPGEGKKFGTDYKLKKIGWWHPTPDGHANDSMRHLLVGAVRTGLVRGEELL